MGNKVITDVARKKFSIMKKGMTELIAEAKDIQKEFALPKKDSADILITTIIQAMEKLQASTLDVRFDDPDLHTDVEPDQPAGKPDLLA